MEYNFCSELLKIIMEKAEAISGAGAASVTAERFLLSVFEGIGAALRTDNGEDLDEYDFLSDFDAEYCYGEDDLKETYNKYINDKYYDWVREHDHEFIAERVGRDINACRDDNEVNYIIMME